MYGNWPGLLAVTAAALTLIAGPTATAIAAPARTASKPAAKASSRSAPAKAGKGRKASLAPARRRPPAAPVAVKPPLPGGFMVPKQVVLRKTTATEDVANAVWNMRAALNVGALQCQYSSWLRTVSNYNDMLRHHSDELVSAQQTMLAHFRRYDGARGANSFDQYTTRTYNSFSTLDAQYSFCEAVGRIGRDVLAAPRGALGETAVRLLPQIRAALGNVPLAPALAMPDLQPLPLDPILPDTAAL